MKKYKFLYMFLIIITLYYERRKYLQIFLKNETENEYEKKCNLPEVYSVENLFAKSFTFNKNSILILEIYEYHYECTPGFAKYFIDLGYDVDIIMHSMGLTSFCFFQPIQKVRLFFYENIDYIKRNDDHLSNFYEKYNYILIETTEANNYQLYQKINFNNTFFVFHYVDEAFSLPLKNIIKKYQIIYLGNFHNGTKINPHYFGEFLTKNKNEITTFFITSTIYRSYELLISAVKTLKNEGKNFHIIVIGKVETLSKNNIPEELNNYFTFKYRISYSELYKDVYYSDYIIINLDPNLKEDYRFKSTRVTGSAQLSYGFLKPVLINKEFANFYNFNYSNSIIYENFNFTEAMREAIIMKNEDYNKIKENLSFLSKDIYIKSLFNLKNCLGYSKN